MSTTTNSRETPPELKDSEARITQAWANYDSLGVTLNEFLYDYVKGMPKGWDPERETYVLQFRHPDDALVTGLPKVLVAQVAENLRSALEYMVYELSVLNYPNLDEWVPQFPIAKTRDEFDKQARGRLKYLPQDQVEFVEKQQPYHGNLMLRVLAEITNPSKHRCLVSLRTNTDLVIVFAEMTKKDMYADYFVYPVENGNAFFARPMNDLTFALLDQYDAMPALRNLIESVESIVRQSEQFFQT